MAKRIILVTFIAMSYIFLSLQPVLAWGPERPTYTMKEPADHAVFNSITDNAAIGDEREFVRIAEVRTDNKKNKYTTNLEIEAGKDYEVYIYFHNDASATLNDKEHDYKGVAMNTRFSTDFPSKLGAMETGEVYGAFSSTSTDPKKVWDTAKITAKEDMTLHYVTGSAKIHNGWNANGSIISTKMFSNEGTFIGMNELNGMIFGCDEFSGHITYKIRTMKPSEFEAQRASDDATSNEENADDKESIKEEIVSENAEMDGQTDNPKKPISPVILVCAGTVVGVVLVKILNSRRK